MPGGRDRGPGLPGEIDSPARKSMVEAPAWTGNRV